MSLDYKAFTVINNLSGQNHLLDLLMIGLAKYGVLVYGLILLYLWFKPASNKTENRKLVLKALISALIGLGINQIIGLCYFRPRPFAHHHVNMLIDKSSDPSFPSDHATGSGALTFSVLHRKPVLGTVMSLLTILLIISRVYVGTHYPLDVLGGLFTGAIGLAITNILWKFFDRLSDAVLKIYNKVLPI